MNGMYLRSLSFPYLFNSTLGFIRHLPSDASISLRNVVMEIHKDVITFWNFKQDRFEDEVLN